MSVFQRMLETQLILFIYILAGFIVRKAGLINPGNRSAILKLQLYLVIPSMLFSSFNREITAQELSNGAASLIITAASAFLGLAVGAILFGRRGAREKSVMLFGSMFPNAGSAGIPIISMVFGEVGVFYTSMSLMAIVALIWTVGLSLYVRNASPLEKLKKMINPSIISIVLGFSLMIMKVRLPGFVTGAVSGLGAMSAPLAMLLVGVTLAEIAPKELITKSSIELSLTRLIIIPLIMLGALKLFGVDALLTSVLVVLFGMPVASNTTILAENFGGDYHLASRCIALSALLCTVTAPLITLLFG